MRGKMLFVGGLAVGFVLGTRAGREKYEQLLVQGRKMLDHPTLQEAAGLAQAQATRLYTEGREKLSNSKLGEKLGATNDRHELTPADNAFAGTPVGATSTSTSGATADNTAKPAGTGTNGSTR